eukprot:1682464-Pleurochrysis_carterae.AAC.4
MQLEGRHASFRFRTAASFCAFDLLRRSLSDARALSSQARTPTLTSSHCWGATAPSQSRVFCRCSEPKSLRKPFISQGCSRSGAHDPTARLLARMLAMRPHAPCFLPLLPLCHPSPRVANNAGVMSRQCSSASCSRCAAATAPLHGSRASPDHGRILPRSL